MRRSALLILWLLLDMTAFVASYAIAYFLRVGFILSTDFPFGSFIATALLVSPLWLIVLMTTRTFALTKNQANLRNLLYIVYACVVGTALFALAYYFSVGLFFSRLLLGLALILSIVITWLVHLAFDRIQRLMLRRNPPTYPTLIIGVTRESTALIERLNRQASPLTPVAVLDGRGAKEKDIDGVPVEGKLHKLEETIARHKITHIIQCSDLEQSINLLSACRGKGIVYMLLPSVLGIVGGNERVEMLEGQPVTTVHPERKWWHEFFA